MARGTRMSGFFLLLTLSSIFLATDASRPANGLSHDNDKGRKLIDIQGFDVTSLLGGLGGQSPDDEGDSDPSTPSSLEEDVAKQAPSILAGLEALRQSQDEGDSDGSPPSSLEEDVTKSAPTLLAGLAAFRQSQGEGDSAASPPVYGDDTPNLFEGLNSLRESLNNGASPPVEEHVPASAPSPSEGHVDILAPSPEEEQLGGEPAPSPGEGHGIYAPSYGNGHIAVSPSPSSRWEGYDDDDLAPSPGKGHDNVASSPSPSPSPGEAY